MGLEARIDDDELADPAVDLAKPRDDGLLVVVEARVGLVAELGETRAIRLHDPFLEQRLLFLRRQAGLLDLVRLVLEHLALVLSLPRSFPKRAQRRLRLAQPPEGLEQRLGQGLNTRVTIEDIDVGLRVQEALCLMLAVYRDQARRQVLQQRDGHQGAIDRGPRLPRALDLASDHDLVALCRQPVGVRVRREAGGLQDSLHDGLALAGPDQLARGPGAQQDPERVDQDRLPSSRFSCQEVEPGAELELEPGDKGYIADFKELDHQGDPGSVENNIPIGACKSRSINEQRAFPALCAGLTATIHCGILGGQRYSGGS